MKRTYAYKSFYKIMGIGLLIIGTVAAVLNFLVGDPIAFLLLLTALMGFLQVRQYTKPYVAIEDGIVTVQASAFKKFDYKLKDIEEVEKKKNQLILTMTDHSNKSILLNFLKAEEKERLSVELSELVASGAVV